MKILKMLHKLLKILTKLIVMVSIFGSIVLILLVVFWFDYPYRVIDFYGKIQIIPLDGVSSASTDMPKVKSGDPIYFQIDYCKYTDLPAVVETTFQDSVIYSTPTVVTSNVKGCRVMKILSQIPLGLPPEIYTMTKTYEYQVNPLRVIRVSVDSEPFQIVK